MTFVHALYKKNADSLEIHTLVLNASASLLKFLLLPSFQKCLEYIITTSKVQKYPLLLNKTIKSQFNTKIVNVKEFPLIYILRVNDIINEKKQI